MSQARRFVAVFTLLCFGLGFSERESSGGIIGPGFDLFETISPTTVTIDLGAGPISLPLQGVPLAPSSGLGTTDTIVRRFGPSLPPLGTGTVPIEIVALHLVSVNPIMVGTDSWDLHALINPGVISGLPTTSLPQSTGQMQVTSHNDPLGGTFDSFFDVFIEISLTPVGGGLHGTGTMFLPPFQTHLQSTNNQWTHVPPDLYPNDPDFPSGGFYPIGPITEAGPNAIHTVTNASVPEPSTLTILGFGITGLVGIRFRQRWLQRRNTFSRAKKLGI